MGLRIYLRHWIDLGPHWLSKEDYQSIFADNLEGLVELLEEDSHTVLDDAGGLRRLIERAEWIESWNE